MKNLIDNLKAARSTEQKVEALDNLTNYIDNILENHIKMSVIYPSIILVNILIAGGINYGIFGKFYPKAKRHHAEGIVAGLAIIVNGLLAVWIITAYAQTLSRVKKNFDSLTKEGKLNQFYKKSAVDRDKIKRIGDTYNCHHPDKKNLLRSIAKKNENLRKIVLNYKSAKKDYDRHSENQKANEKTYNETLENFIASISAPIYKKNDDAQPTASKTPHANSSYKMEATIKKDIELYDQLKIAFGNHHTSEGLKAFREANHSTFETQSPECAKLLDHKIELLELNEELTRAKAKLTDHSTQLNDAISTLNLEDEQTQEVLVSSLGGNQYGTFKAANAATQDAGQKEAAKPLLG